jgi:hypothetical protein
MADLPGAHADDTMAGSRAFSKEGAAMTKPVSGQYECLHRSPIGLDYFTGRVDRLTLLENGRFVLITQERTRLVGAAQALLQGQQAALQTKETRREGHYLTQERALILQFDDGSRQEGQFSWNGEGIQLGKDFFQKVSDTTLFPPPQRLKKDMDDIAKGLKIAATLGGLAVKAAKTLQETVQTNASAPPATPAPARPAQPPHPSPSPPVQPPQSAPPAAGAPFTAAGQSPQPSQESVETLFCDQCGARARPGKRYCGQCGALLP